MKNTPQPSASNQPSPADRVERGRERLNMPKAIRAYIATHRPTRFDGFPREVYRPISDRFGYGIKIWLGTNSTDVGCSWVKSKEPMFPQITAVSCLLDVIEEVEEPFELQLILRSGHLLRRIGTTEDRLLNIQMGRRVRGIKDEEVWVDTTRRLRRMKYGIRPALSDSEVSQLVQIEETLKNGFYHDQSLSSATPPQADLILPDGKRN